MTSYCPKCGEPTYTLGRLEEQILIMIRQSSTPISSAQVVARCASGRGSVYRALRSLEDKGFIKGKETNPFGVKRFPLWQAVKQEEAA